MTGGKHATSKPMFLSFGYPFPPLPPKAIPKLYRTSLWSPSLALVRAAVPRAQPVGPGVQGDAPTSHPLY